MAGAQHIITVTMNTAIDRVFIAQGPHAGGQRSADPVSHGPAGKGVNVARALARLGRSSTATGFVGEAEAQWFASSLKSTQGTGRVDCRLIPVPGPTRENTTLIDPDARTDTHQRTQGYAVTCVDLARLSESIQQLAAEGAVVVFTGSLPGGMDDAALYELICTAQRGGARVVLDLNGQTLGTAVQSLEKPVWMISPNHQEFAEALGHDVESDIESLTAAARQANQHAAWVLLSLGARGALMATETSVYHGVCEPDQTRVVNTVSAGDCLLAGVLDAQLQGLSPKDALRQGLTVATASTFQHPSAGFELSDAQTLIASTKVIKI